MIPQAAIFVHENEHFMQEICIMNNTGSLIGICISNKLNHIRYRLITQSDVQYSCVTFIDDGSMYV